jgi:hypothetical protein
VHSRSSSAMHVKGAMPEWASRHPLLGFTMASKRQHPLQRNSLALLQHRYSKQLLLLLMRCDRDYAQTPVLLRPVVSPFMAETVPASRPLKCHSPQASHSGSFCFASQIPPYRAVHFWRVAFLTPSLPHLRQVVTQRPAVSDVPH